MAFGNIYEFIEGDVDLGGAVTSADVTAIYSHLLEDDRSHVATSDIDGDGSITAADITALYNIILGY